MRSRACTIVPFVLLILVATLVASPGANDFFQFWWAGHLVVTGRSPYDPAAWTAALAYGPAAGSVAHNCVPADAPACLWVYPPWTAWAFAPLGALEPEAAIALYRIALGSALAVGGLVWVRLAGASPVTATVLLVALGASAASVRDVATGHFEGALLVGLGLVAIGGRRRSPWLALVGAAIVALKPHVAFALVPAVVAWLALQRAYRVLVALCVALALLVVAGFASDALAWAALTGRPGAKLELGTATTWGASAVLAGPAWPAIAAVVVGITVGGFILTWRSAIPRAEVVVAASAAVSLAIAPYAQSYDAVLLFPAFAVAFGRTRLVTAAVGALAAVALTWMGYALELTGAPDPVTGMLPAALVAVLALRSRVDEQRAATLAPA